VSVAVPVMVTLAPLVTLAFSAGEVIAAVGAIVSVEAAVATSPDIREVG
jgi:hypothetical protein